MSVHMNVCVCADADKSSSQKVHSKASFLYPLEAAMVLEH